MNLFINDWNFKIMTQKQWILFVLMAVALQGVSRFSAVGWVDFCQDDWHFWNVARSMKSVPDIVAATCLHPFRPVSAMVQLILFHSCGDRPWIFYILGMIMHTVFLLVLMRILYALSRDTRVAFIGAAIFSLLPNLTESFYWPELNAISYVYVAYGLSALFWIRYARTGCWSDCVISVLGYVVGVFSYETGAFLPLAYPVLLGMEGLRRAGKGFMPFAAVMVFYLLWRTTLGFGLGQNILYPNAQLTPAISMDIGLWNLKEILRWWIGGYFLDSLRSGLNGFLDLSVWHQRALGVLDCTTIMMCLWLWGRSRRREVNDHDVTRPAFLFNRTVFFGCAWVCVAYFPCLVSYTAGRLNYLPAVGIALVLSLILVRWFNLSKPLGIVALAILCLMVNQGTAHSWKVSGQFQRHLFNYVKESEPQWCDKDLVLFDTLSLQQRLTQGLLHPVKVEDKSWYHNQNAVLFKGFALNAMLELVATSNLPPRGILDAEHYAQWDNDTLIWHEKWDANVCHSTSVDKVFFIDCFEAGQGALSEILYR
ncbi:MAG: hypothetical protein A2X46_05115 [Lentisphaerae bacterium GWF2_57_35]|nr:MAG: hypothetical protein A2X46_05115 [Lentisphaerae bacterium GWF2_57_35]